MSSNKGRRTCEICGIKEAHLENKLFFASFPIDVQRCREWVRVTGNSDLVSLPIEKLHYIKHICGNHFKKKDFNKKGNKLKKRALPCLNLISAPLSDHQMSEFPLHVYIPPSEPRPSTSKDGQGQQAMVVCSEVDAPGLHVGQDSSSQVKPSTSKEVHETTVISSGYAGTTQVTSSEPRPSTSKDGQGQQAIVVCSEVNAPGLHVGQASSSQVKPSTSKEVHVTTVISSGYAVTTQETRTPKIPRVTAKPVITEGKGVKRRLIGSDDELTPRKKKLVERLNKTKCSLKSLQKSAILLEKIQSPVLRELILNSCKNEKRKPKARRWTTQQKLSSLAILKRSQKTYRYLSSLVTLPTIKTLQNILKKVPLIPGISQSVLNYLKTVADSTEEKDKICSLVFDEMAIKSRLIYNEANDIVEGFEDLGELGRSSELANHALVLMLQGLRKKSKQPIAFYFTKGTIPSQKLAIIIKNVIKQVKSCGFTVLNTVCDQGSTNMGALKILKEASGPSQAGANHYFQVDEQKVYIIYDIPHLFKSIRNNFMKAGSVVLNGRRGKWEHLVEVETHNRNFLYLSKISEVHINPKYKAKMRVKLAAQLLSNTVSAVLKLLARAERDDKAEDLLNTAYVVEELDQLFDISNGPSGPQDIKKKKRENVSEKSNHMNQWAHYIKILENTKFLNTHGVELKNVKCIEGYIISLKSLRDIWVTVSKMGYKYLNLRSLNQDALENLFGVIRQHSPTNRNPTASHFIAAIKTAVVTGLTAPHSRGANCEADNKKLLMNFHNFVFTEDKPHDLVVNLQTTEREEDHEEIDEDYPLLEIPEIDVEEVSEIDFTVLEQQPVVYVAGFVAKSIFKKITCDECKLCITVQNAEDNQIYTYILLREWWQNKFSLTYPSVRFCEMIQTLVTTAEKELIPRLHEPNICLLACTLFTVNNESSCFQCSTHVQIITDLCYKLTSKMLIRRQCQRVNQSLASNEEPLASLMKKAEQQGKAK